IFEEKGVIELSAQGIAEEDAFEKSIEAGAMDFEADADNGVYRVYTVPAELNVVAQALSAGGLSVLSAEVTRTPQNTVQVTSEDVAKPLLKLLDAIESHDDVQNVYANFEMDEALLTRLEPA
ncbi:MAG TPA: YebC/PmpR family DNA-binding transcriptional regulator, partial [Oculatellaceae cyanobacterium]